MSSAPKTSAADIVAAGAGELTTSAALYGEEIDRQIATAKAYPRNLTGFQTTAQALATASVEIAEACEYAIPRDGKQITGPSARFAEILAYTFGNCRASGRIIEIGAKHVTAQGVFHDLENNAAKSIEVKRRITGKDGRRFNEDMITTTCQAAVSIATRNATVAGIPRGLWEPAFNAAREAAKGTKEEFPKRIELLMKAFDEMGIAPQRVLKRAGYESTDQFTPQKYKFFRNMYVALKDGDMTADEVFPRDDAKASKRPTLDDLAEEPAKTEQQTATDEQLAFSDAVKKRLYACTTAQQIGEEMASVAHYSTYRPLPDWLLASIVEVSKDALGILADASEKAASEAQDATDEEDGPEDSPASTIPLTPMTAVLEGPELKALCKTYLRQIERSLTQGHCDDAEAKIMADGRLPNTECQDLLDTLSARRAELPAK